MWIKKKNPEIKAFLLISAIKLVKNNKIYFSQKTLTEVSQSQFSDH